MAGADPGGSRTYSLDPSSGGASFARLLFALLRQRFTGTVTVEQRAPSGERCVWVRGGMPVFCDWQSPGDLLGELLIEAGAITLDDLEQVLADQQQVADPVGQLLLEQGVIDDKVLSAALRTQCKRKLVHVFGPTATQGSATVTTLEHDKGAGDGLSQLNVLELLTLGVKRHYKETRLEDELGEIISGDLVATPAFVKYERQFAFAPEDAVVLGAIARGVTIERLISPRVTRERALQLIYILWVTQMLRSGADATQAIAKGSTAAASAQALGVTVGGVKPAKAPAQAKPPPAPKSKSKPKPKPPSKPKAAAKAPPPPPQQPAPEPESKQDKPEQAKPRGSDPEFEALLAEFEGRVVAEANAFVLFGLEPDADRKAIRSVWAELSKRFHPDSLEGRQLSHLRERVEPVFAALSEAYGVLGNKVERQKLRDALEIGGQNIKSSEDTSAVVRNAFEAEHIAREGDKFLKAKRWQKAAELYTRAHALSPQDMDIAAAFHYASYRAGEPSSDLVRITIDALTRVVEEQPVCARAYYFMGLLQLGTGDVQEAKTNFAKAAKLDPRNIDAERQLRAIRSRQQDASTKKKAEAKKSSFGGLRDLFKK